MTPRTAGLLIVAISLIFAAAIVFTDSETGRGLLIAAWLVPFTLLAGWAARGRANTRR